MVSCIKNTLAMALLLLAIAFPGSHAEGQSLVSWTNTVGVTQVADSVKRNAGSGDAGASSLNWLASGQDGWVEVYYSNVSAAGFHIGLTKGDMDQNYQSILYDAYIQTGNLYLFESGVLLGSFGSLIAGDTVRIERSGDSIRYSKNGTVLHTSYSGHTDELMVDVSLNVTGSFVSNVRTNIGNALRIGYSVTGVLPPSTGNGAIALLVTGGTPPYSYSWGGGASTSSVGSLSPGTYTVTVTDDVSATATAAITVGYQVLWTDTVNVSTTGNSISSPATTYTAGASSVNYIPPGGSGYLQCVVTKTNPASYQDFVFGLSGQDMGIAIPTIEYAIWKYRDHIQVQESGVNQGSAYSIAVGDTLRVERDGDTIRYRRNGTVFRSVYTDHLGRMIVDVSMGQGTPEMRYIRTDIGLPFGMDPVVTDQLPGQPGTGAIAPGVLGGTAPYAYAWSDGSADGDRTGLDAGTYALTVTDAAAATATATIEVGYQLLWQNKVSVTATTGNSISSNATSYTGGASTKNYLAPYEDGYLRFLVSYNSAQQFNLGLSTKDTTVSYLAIQYALNQRTVIVVYESGTNKTPSGFTYKVGDTVSVSRQGDSIYYRLNSTLMWKSHTDRSKPLLGDFSFGTGSPSVRFIKTNMGNAIDSNGLYWTGAEDSIWSNPNNWAHYINGASNLGPPSSNSSVVFDSHYNKGCIVQSQIHVKNISFNKNYTAYLHLGADTVVIDSDLVLGEAAFISTSGLLKIKGSLIDTNQLFNHNNGRVEFAKDSGYILLGKANDIVIDSGIKISLLSSLAIGNSINIGNGYLDLNSHLIEITNDNPNAISYTNGGIISERVDFASSLLWHVNDEDSIPYSVPFLSDSGASLICSVKFLSPGYDSLPPVLQFSTFPTDPQIFKNNSPAPLDLSTIDNQNHMVDRFWLIDALNYTSSPLANISFKYNQHDLEGLNLINSANLHAKVWGGSTWTNFVNDSIDSTEKKVAVDSVNVFGVWALSDNEADDSIDGSTCQRAVLIQDSIGLPTYSITDSVYWYKFVSIDSSLDFTVAQTNRGIPYSLERITLYQGGCESLAFITDSVVDSTGIASIHSGSLLVPNIYYIKINIVHNNE